MESYANFFNDEWHSFGQMFNDSEVSYDQFANIFTCVSDESSNVDSFMHLANACDDVNSSFNQLLANENIISSNDASAFPFSYPYQDNVPFCPSNIVPLSNGNLPQEVAEENVRMENSLVSSTETALKRKHEARDSLDVEFNNQKTDKNYKKRKTRINVPSKKSQQTNDTENASNNQGERSGQSSSSCSSNDECDRSEDLTGASNQNGKTRASRGTATDPQSLYARKRRERINERLRILQNLVPNGTKVDISTMLEEAVEYVKFLKLQIKLLSSDEMWMYAPIAYNGMNMGLYQNITPNLKFD